MKFVKLSCCLLLCLVVFLGLTACDRGTESLDTTAAPTEPVTEAPTAADTTIETLTEPAKGGCGSAVTFGLAAILVAAAAVVVRKKD